MERVATCACGRLAVRVRGEPQRVLACQCEFCLKRTGGLYPVAAWFGDEQVVEITGDSNLYNGLDVDGVAALGGLGISYHFCPTCGSTVYWTFDTVPDDLAQFVTADLVVAAGSFADPNLPPPDDAFFPDLGPRWLTVAHGPG